MDKFINLFLDISPSLTIAHYGFLPRTSCLNGLFMENEYNIHIIFDDHKLHAFSFLGTRCTLAVHDYKGLHKYLVLSKQQFGAGTPGVMSWARDRRKSIVAGILLTRIPYLVAKLGLG